ncbi:protein adenylyltransferase SelO [Undibacterium sp. RuRC25W]|uniref:protein adenylyltransferase SelO n=1 Tax=Undibacterium sp. RuRC25W TaxID=3413047 RepID=UPI003BF42BBC
MSVSNDFIPDGISSIEHFLQISQFANLPPSFFTHLRPTPLPEPYLVSVSPSQAEALNIKVEQFNQREVVAFFTGNQLPANATPLATVYSGHQFGVWAGQLGDGRAILLGDTVSKDLQRLEVQLKGAGPTPYSRSGDGRAVLRSSIREFLCSEAMHALGIPTSRALCITGSDHYVFREAPETTAVVTRLAPSFIRFGSFEHWYYHRRHDELKVLADFVIDGYYPECKEDKNPYQSLLTIVTRKTAELMALWQSVGFMHGVMNTDNMSILGLTLDYGPFGFMEAFDEAHICNHTDQQGRYSYKMQPSVGNWNMHALGQAMLPLIGTVEDTQAALSVYASSFTDKWASLMRAKLGFTTSHETDKQLADDFFALLQANHADFTLSFRNLSHLENDISTKDIALLDLFIDREALKAWLERYRARLKLESSNAAIRQTAMLATNPKYILRNYLAQNAIEKAQNKDFSEITTLLSVLKNPFDEQPDNEAYSILPPDWAKTLEVSCSS